MTQTIPQNPAGVTLRSLVLDSPFFPEFDPYYTEFVLRQGVQEYVTLLGELLGNPLIHLLRYAGEQSVLNMLRLYTPYFDTLISEAQAGSVTTPTLMLTDSSLAMMLFVENGEPNAMFEGLYSQTLDYDAESWRSLLRQFVAVSTLSRRFGVELLELFGSGKTPTQEQTEKFGSDWQAAIAQQVGVVAAPKCDSSKAQPTAQEIFRPENLN